MALDPSTPSTAPTPGGPATASVPATGTIITTDAAAEPWTNRRILMLLALGTLIVSVIWHAPEEASYISERAGEIFVTLVLAMSFTYLLRPFVNALNRRPAFGSGSRQGRMWATAVVFIGCGLLLYVFILVGLRPLTDSVRDLWENWFVGHTAAERQELMRRWQVTLQKTLQPYQGLLPTDATGDLNQAIPKYAGIIRNYAAKSVGHWFSHVGFIVELLLVPVLVFYFLCDGPAIRAEARLLMPLAWRPHASRMCAHFDRVFDGYIRGQVIMCIIAWVAVTAGLLLLRVPYAFTLGLIAGLTRAVPVIGPLLGGVPIILVCLVTTKSLPVTTAVLLGFTAMHFIESKVLLPKVVGHEVDLHPVAVIVSLLLGMEFFGFMGIFLAVPIAAVLKIALTEWHATCLERMNAQANNNITPNVNAAPAMEATFADQSTVNGLQHESISGGVAPSSVPLANDESEHSSFKRVNISEELPAVKNESLSKPVPTTMPVSTTSRPERSGHNEGSSNGT